MWFPPGTLLAVYARDGKEMLTYIAFSVSREIYEQERVPGSFPDSINFSVLYSLSVVV